MLLYYSDVSRYRDPNIKMKGLVQALGEDIGVIEMPTQDQLFAYGADHEEIKSKIADLFHLHCLERITKSELDQLLGETWIPLIMSFIEKWDADHVAYDIRCSIGSVRRKLDLTVVQCQKFLCLTIKVMTGFVFPSK